MLIVIDDVVRFEVDGDSNIVEFFINGVSVGILVDIFSILSNISINVGMFGWILNLFIDDLDLGIIVSDLIIFDNELLRKVYVIFGFMYNYIISGIYEGVMILIVIEYWVEEFVSGVVVIDWIILDVVLIGGVFLGVVDILCGFYYKIFVRYVNVINI